MVRRHAYNRLLVDEETQSPLTKANDTKHEALVRRERVIGDEEVQQRTNVSRVLEASTAKAGCEVGDTRVIVSDKVEVVLVNTAR
jgi:hypothetical protein